MNNKFDFSIDIDYDTLLDFVGIAVGLFYPLRGFMDSADFYSVVNNMCLKNGDVFTVPVTFPIDTKVKNILTAKLLKISYQNREVGFIKVEDIYEARDADFFEVFRTKDAGHPGLNKQLKKSKTFVGGEVILTDKNIVNELEMVTPEKTKSEFKKNGWKTIAGFHTRNAIHRAHEHLQRTALELCDGLLISPFMGWRKKGDFTEEAIKLSYKIMMEKFYPKNRVFFHGIRASIRYAGPREAIFTAILRRNLGCTHFIIGRDHSGVENYYGKYDSQKLAVELQKQYNLGIKILLLSEPYYCKICGETVSAKNCAHIEKDIVPISGTTIRKGLLEKTLPPSYMMRPEIANKLIKLENIFVK
ncbi:MAG: sulfate adenylyltransferase [bacterium]|nr:sulfate adenylyltransferase [bacterium]